MNPIHSDWITRFSQALRRFIDVVNELQQLIVEYDRRDLSTALTPDDFVGENSVITAEALTTAITVLASVLSAPTEAEKKALYKVMR